MLAWPASAQPLNCALMRHEQLGDAMPRNRTAPTDEARRRMEMESRLEVNVATMGRSYARKAYGHMFKLASETFFDDPSDENMAALIERTREYQYVCKLSNGTLGPA